MTSGLEAAGDLASGAVLAGAIEPAIGGHEAHGACPNCGTSLIGPYCHGCGQSGHIHRSLGGFGHDLVHGVFHFEGKIWNTLPLLFFKPGELTRRYIHGERAKFVSPIAGFLFCVFLMFAVVRGLAGDMHMPDDARDAQGNVQLGGKPEALQKQIDGVDKELAALRSKIDAEGKAGRDTAQLEAELEELESGAEGMKTGAQVMSGIKIGRAVDGTASAGINTPWPALNRGLEKVRENPNLFLYRLQSSAYKYSWALIPISTPLVWLLFFWKRRFKLYDHLVFVTFSLTFMMIFVTLLTALGAIGLGGGWLTAAMLLVPPVHMYRQLRGAYEIGRVSALLRTAALICMGGIALTLYLLLLLAMGVFH